MGEVFFKRSFLILSICSFIFIAAFSVGVLAAHPLYPSFSSPKSGFAFNNVSNLASVSDTAVYRYGYYSINGSAWQNFSLSGTFYPSSTSWLSGSATATLPSFGVGEHYIIIYSCTYNSSNSSWDCQENKWQLIIVNITGSSNSSNSSLKYLVQSSAGNADIIVSSTVPNTVKLAANFFQMYIYNMTGVLLPISNTVNGSKQYHVYIGQSSYTDALGITSAGCEYGGFKMVSGDNYLALLGDDAPLVLSGPTTMSQWDAFTGDTWANNFIDFYPGNYNSAYNIWKTDGRGSMNAVFEFLYNQGIRWYSPSEIGTVIPTKSSISFGNVNSLINPEFQMRSFYIYFKEFGHLEPYLYQADYDNEMQWQLSLRSNSFYEFMIGGVGGGPGHGTEAIISRPETRAEHPEYYSVLNGVRQDGVPDLCSQGLLQENVKYAKAMFDAYNVSVVTVMPSDGYQGPSESSASASCLPMATPERGWESGLSDYVWEYVNNVAWAIYNDPKYAGKKIMNAAYPPYLLPPLHLSKPVAPNLVVMLTRTRSNFADEATNVRYENITNQWLNFIPSKEVYTYDYYLYNIPGSQTQSLPAYFPHIIFNDLKNLKSNNSKGEYMEVYSNWPLDNRAWDTFAATSFDVYLTARAYWDTDQDVNALLNEYYTLYYGPASTQMKAFVEYSEANYVNALANPAVFRTMRQMLTNARAVAGNTVYGQRIDPLIALINSNFAGEEVMINSCQDLNSPTTTYKLTSDVSSAGTCFTIASVGITIDCQGYTITYATDGGANEYGIAKPDWYNIANGLIVKNCNIKSSGSSTGVGINLGYVSGVVIQDSKINTTGDGIWVVNVDNVNVTRTNITSLSGRALSTQTMTGGTFSNNILSSTSGWGLYLYDTHNVTVIYNNASSVNDYGAVLMRSTNNMVTDNRFTSVHGQGFWEYESSGNTYLRNTIVP